MIINLLDKAGLPEPEFMSEAGHFTVTFRIPEEKRLTPHVTPYDIPQVEQLLGACKKPKSRQELQNLLGISDRKYFRTHYLKSALEAGLIEQTLPHAPKSKLQKYRLTQAGSMYLQKVTKGQA